jgi:urease accessory protein UreF
MQHSSDRWNVWPAVTIGMFMRRHGVGDEQASTQHREQAADTKATGGQRSIRLRERAIDAQRSLKGRGRAVYFGADQQETEHCLF